MRDLSILLLSIFINISLGPSSGSSFRLLSLAILQGSGSNPHPFPLLKSVFWLGPSMGPANMTVGPAGLKSLFLAQLSPAWQPSDLSL